MLIFFRQKVKTSHSKLAMNLEHLKPTETVQLFCCSNVLSGSVAHGKSHALGVWYELPDAVAAYFSV